MCNYKSVVECRFKSRWMEYGPEPLLRQMRLLGPLHNALGDVGALVAKGCKLASFTKCSNSLWVATQGTLTGHLMRCCDLIGQLT